ncbi:MAG: hypothetical protein KBC43_06005 [Bacteroidales bacterium]|nr:hypothetical protein [Bacteroidales bacterium]
MRSVCGFDVPKIDHFWLEINELQQINPLNSGGVSETEEPGEDMTWYQYTSEGGESWYNIWFYNDTVDTTRMKIIKLGFWVQRLDPAATANIYYVVNWSTEDWDPPVPGFPMPAEEVYVDRSPTNGPIPVIAADLINPYGQWIEISYTIPDFNPEWVSVDIWGDNITILPQPIAPPITSSLFFWWEQSPLPGGIMVHECLPKPVGNTSDWTGPIGFNTLPQCPPPVPQPATNISQTGADINYDPFFELVELELGPAGYVPGSGLDPSVRVREVNQNPYPVDGLDHSTDYDAWLRGDCGFTETAETRIDNFHLAIDPSSALVPALSGGATEELDPGENLTWYLYDQGDGMSWYNIWFYNDTVDPNRMKKIRMGFWIQTYEPVDGQLFYVVNWSTPDWDPPVPGFPMPDEEDYIERSPVNGPLAIMPGPAGRQWIELYYIIPDYNPEWVSVDIWGFNIQILDTPDEPPVTSLLRSYWNPLMPGGIIVHECLPKNSGPTSQWAGPISFTTLCGVFSVPYEQNFDSKIAPEIPNCMTVIDDNSDLYTWVTNTSYARSAPNGMYIRWNSALAMDDWFFTPPISLSPGTYNLCFWYRGSGATFPEKMEVKWGSAPTEAGMTNGPVFDNSNITNPAYEEAKADIVVTSAGDYYVGWHGYSDADMYLLAVDNISIRALYIWTGSVSTDWTNPSNWDRNAAPDMHSNVLIPAAPSGGVFPDILSSQSVNCGDLYIEEGAAVNVQPGGILNVRNP